MASRAPIDWQPPANDPSRVLTLTPYQAPEPQTGFLDNFSASQQEMEIAGNIGSSDRNLAEAYRPILDALDAAGATRSGQTMVGQRRLHYLNPGNLTEDPLTNGYADVPGRSHMRQMIFDEIRRQRQARPDFLQGVPDNPDEFERQANERTRARLQSIRETQGNASTMGRIGGFIGGVAGSFEDPVNIATLPIGGESVTFVRQVGRAVIENMVMEALSQPLVRQNYANLGEDQTLGDSVSSVLMAGVAGGAFHLGARGAAEIGERAIGPLYDRMAEGVFNALPEHIQRAVADSATIGDHLLIDVLHATVPQENWTPDLRAAVNVVQRDVDIASASPFEPTPAGDAEHGATLADALRRIVDDTPPVRAEPPALPARQPITAVPVAPAAGDLANARNPAFETVKARIRHVESGGNDSIPNAAGSSALGRFQFTDGTWLSYYRRRYGPAGSDAEVLARKRDGNIQEVLMDDALGDYALMLRRVGAPVDAGNLYMTHGLGVGGAEAFLRADPGERAIDVYRRVDPRHADAALRQNPFLHGTVGDTIAWFHRRMGGAAPPPMRVAEAAPHEGVPVAEDVPAEAVASGPVFDDRPVLRTDQFASAEEHARAQLEFEAARDARDGFNSPAREEAFRAGRRDAATMLADAGGIRNDEGHDLVNGRNLPRFAPGGGLLVRPNGMSIDRAGEYLWERGFFGPPSTTARPPTDEVLGFIERAAHERVFTPEDQADFIQSRARAASPSEAELWDHITSDVHETWGGAMDILDTPEIRARTAAIHGDPERWEHGESAYGAALDELSSEQIRAIRTETGSADYDPTSFDFGPARGGDHPTGARDGRSASESGQPFASRSALARSEVSTGAIAASLAPSARDLAQFDEPMGKAALAQTDSLEHDLMAAIEKDPGLKERPFIVDAVGESATLDAILQELDADKAAAAALRGCL